METVVLLHVALRQDGHVLLQGRVVMLFVATVLLPYQKNVMTEI